MQDTDPPLGSRTHTSEVMIFFSSFQEHIKLAEAFFETETCDEPDSQTVRVSMWRFAP